MSGVDAAELTGSVPPAKARRPRHRAGRPANLSSQPSRSSGSRPRWSLVRSSERPLCRRLGHCSRPCSSWAACCSSLDLPGKPYMADSAPIILPVISIVASALLGEYLAGAIVVLMLSGGETLEQFAVARATAALRALASRVPTLAHRRRGRRARGRGRRRHRRRRRARDPAARGLPGRRRSRQRHGAMDESYLTGEPFTIAEGPGREGPVRRDQRRLRSCASARPGSRPTRGTRRSCR